MDLVQRIIRRLTRRPILHAGACSSNTVSPGFQPCLKLAASGLFVILAALLDASGDDAEVPQRPRIASAVSS